MIILLRPLRVIAVRAIWLPSLPCYYADDVAADARCLLADVALPY